MNVGFGGCINVQEEYVEGSPRGSFVCVCTLYSMHFLLRQYCQAVWLGLFDGKSNIFPETKDEHKIRDFMITKYEKKR